jgi:hypothetical protein
LVQRKETIYGNNRVFTSSQQNLLVTGANRYYTDGFTISGNGLSTSGTDPTFAAVFQNLITTFQLDVAGIPQIRLSLEQIYAMNVLKLGNNPLTVNAGSTNNQTWEFSSLWIPAWMPPSNSNMTASLTYGGDASFDNERISFAAHFLDGIPRTEAQYYNVTDLTTSGIDSTAYGNATADINLVGNMTGLMVRSTTIPGAAVAYNRGTVQEVRVQDNGETLAVWDWYESQNPKIFTGQYVGALEGSPGNTSILDNYRYIDMSKEPIAAGHKVSIVVNAGVTAEAVSVIPFQSVPFSR